MGELERRISELGVWDLVEQDWDHELIRKNDKITKIVDEARKELMFLLEFIEVTDSTNEKCMGMPIAVLVDLNRLRELKEKFVKWFGEEAK